MIFVGLNHLAKKLINLVALIATLTVGTVSARDVHCGNAVDDRMCRVETNCHSLSACINACCGQNVSIPTSCY